MYLTVLLIFILHITDKGNVVYFYEIPTHVFYLLG